HERDAIASPSPDDVVPHSVIASLLEKELQGNRAAQVHDRRRRQRSAELHATKSLVVEKAKGIEPLTLVEVHDVERLAQVALPLVRRLPIILVGRPLSSTTGERLREWRSR